MIGELPAGGDAFIEFYDRQGPAVLIFFRRRTWDPEVAMDLTAETFARAFAGRGSFRGTTSGELDAWLFGIARHLLAGFFRHGRAERGAINRLEIRSPRVSRDDLGRIEELAGLRELREALGDQLARLSAQEREAVSLRVVQELPYRIVAQRLDVSEQVARKRVSPGCASSRILWSPSGRRPGTPDE
jgi:RNA polymerase sigma-70 factor (ECF subfamily)